MSNEAPEPAAGAAGGGRKVMPLAIVLLAGLILGGGVGALVAGPMLTKQGAAIEAAGPAADAAPADAAPAAGRGARRDSPPVLFAIENLVLNPAQTSGTRFLMVSAAFELRDSRVVDQIRAREPEVRDVLLRALGEKTVEELTDISARGDLKEDIRRVVDGIFAPGSVREVYLPQFVIQ